VSERPVDHDAAGWALSEPRFVEREPGRLVGMRVTMSVADNRTGELWRRFMPRRGEVAARGAERYSVEVYPAGYFHHFDPAAPFEKWAALPVDDDATVPDGMDALRLPGGLYAVFHLRGPAGAAAEVYGHIYGSWLPTSGYTLADGPHLAVMGEKYRGDDPASEEDIWIPVRPTG
jgi:AraC family transcriptional regulator